MNARRSVSCWVDPLCPWSWLASRWLVSVAEQRPVDLRRRVMSLAHLNDWSERAWGPVRVLTAARLAHGDEVVGRVYEAMGRRLHPGGRDDIAEVIVEAIDEVGLPETLAAAATTDGYDDALLRDHQAGMDLVGDEVGTPVVAIGDVAFFGPVVSPAPTGADALRLFDGLLAVASVDGFFELKRSRDRDPIFA